MSYSATAYSFDVIIVWLYDGNCLSASLENKRINQVIKKEFQMLKKIFWVRSTWPSQAIQQSL